MSVVLSEKQVTRRSVLLSEVVEFNPKLMRDSIADELEVSFVPMAAVEAGSGRMQVSHIRRFSDVKKGFTHFRDGDVLFAKITPCMENGKMAVANGLHNGIGYGSTEFHVLRPSEGLDARYLYYFVSSRAFRREAAHHMTGAVGLRRVPISFLERTEIPIPPMGEQRILVAEIERQFSRLDGAVLNLSRSNRGLIAFKRASLQSIFAGIPISTAKRLEDVCDVVSGCAFKSDDFIGDGVRVVKIANVGYGEFTNKDQEYLPADFENRYPAFRVYPGDVLLALTRPVTDNTLKVCQYPAGAPAALLNQRVALLRSPAVVDMQFLLAFMHSPAFKRQVLGAVSQTLQPNLSPVDLRRFAIPWPELGERVRIVAELDRRLSVVRGVEAQIEANLKRGQALRQAVLAKAFGG